MAADLISGFPVEGPSSDAASWSGMLMQTGGVPALNRWLQNIQSGDQPDVAARAFEFAYRAAIRNPGFATEWLESETASPYVDDSRKEHFANHWGSRDAPAAADWAIQQENPALLQNVLAACPESMFTPMADWLSAHREAGFFGAAATAFAERIRSTDPAAAVRWEALGAGEE
jgi:hypothetical protein